MAEEKELVFAFKIEDKIVAERLLPRIPEPATITTTFEMSDLFYSEISLVSLLHLAAYWGWTNIVNALVSMYKCAANCKDKMGHIPLHYAALKGHLEVVKYFIVELDCDPMDKNEYGRTPLHYACCYGYLNIAQYLIRDKHCDPSCKDNDGETPLHYACIKGHLNIAEYLIGEEHCNPSCEDKYGRTPLYYACNHAHIVKYLLSTGQVNPLTKEKVYGYTALSRDSENYQVIKLFEKFMLGSSDLSVKHLLTKCKNVTDWHTLGIHLDLTTSQLNDIRVTYHAEGVNRLKTEMFTVWLKSSPDASWTDLIRALRAMDENTIASEILAGKHDNTVDTRQSEAIYQI